MANNVPRKFRNQINVDRLNGVYLGIVRKSGDPQKNGRLLVWISDLGPDKEDSWITVAYASPFAGVTDIADAKQADDVTTDAGQRSYGFWATPPDVNNQVLCCFINGDVARGIWFACLYQQNMNHMVPGIGSQLINADTADTQVSDSAPLTAPNSAAPPSTDPTTITAAIPLDQKVVPVKNASEIVKGLFADKITLIPVVASSPPKLSTSAAASDSQPVKDMQFVVFVTRLKNAGFVILEATNRAGDKRPAGSTTDVWHVVLGEKNTSQYPGTQNQPDGQVILPTSADTAIAAGADGIPEGDAASVVPDHSTEYGGRFDVYGPPRIEYDKRNQAITSPTSNGSNAKDTVPRSVFKPLADGLVEQGLDADSQRGVSNSSARRESPSRVFGMLSPRGNQIYIDDGNIEESNEFVRIRTRSGTQVLIHESSGYVYINSKLGKSWLQVGDDGIDLYSAGPISIASDADVNISSGGSTNIQAAGGVKIYTTDVIVHAEGSINLNAEQDILSKAIGDTFFIAAKNFGVGAGEMVGLDAGGDLRMVSCGANIRKAPAILDNTPGSPIPVDATAAADTGAVLTRKPTHEPYERGTVAGSVNADGTVSKNVVGSDGSFSNEPVSVNVSADDLDWVAVCMIHEALGEGNDGMAGVAACIYNRLSAGYRDDAPWARTAKGVILAWKQFSWLNDGGKPDKARETYGLRQIAKWRANPKVWSNALNIAKQVQSNTYAGSDLYRRIRGTPRCLWYFNPNKANPSWARAYKVVCVLKNHRYCSDA